MPNTSDLSTFVVPNEDVKDGDVIVFQDGGKIFTYEGLMIGMGGVILGGLGGSLICTLLKKYQFIRLPRDIYYIDRLPVSVKLWPDIILIILAALIITLVSTVYPAYKAAKLRPAEALRYE